MFATRDTRLQERQIYDFKTRFEDQFGALTPRELIVAMRSFFEGIRDAMAKAQWRGSDPKYLSRYVDLERVQVISEFYSAGFASFQKKFKLPAMNLG